MNQIKATLKFLLSYLKSDWDLGDYPIRCRHQPADTNPPMGRLQPIPWTAQIVNWWTMAGYGQTQEEALQDLRRNFKNRRAEVSSLPRPGTRVPIQFASTADIEGFETIAREFLATVLGLNYDACFISDESSLWDFHDKKNNDSYYERIQERFGVDVSDIEGARLGAIFRRIHEHRNSA